MNCVFALMFTLMPGGVFIVAILDCKRSVCGIYKIKTIFQHFFAVFTSPRNKGAGLPGLDLNSG